MNNAIEQHPRSLAHVRAAIYGQPWAITEHWLDTICGIAENHIAGKPVDFTAAGKPANEPSEEDELGFDMVDDCAIIAVSGPIFPKANLMTALSGATALSDLSENIKNALSLSPSAVILNFDSPGGSVMGLFDFCQSLFETRQASPIPFIGLVNPLCASAAYAIGSQLDALYSTAGGVTGSIGVVTKIDNRERAEKNAGNDPIVLRTSELKAIGAGGGVTPNQQNELTRMMMQYFAQFKDTVSRGRPGVDIDQVSTGQTWMGKSANADPSAQDMGLIDGISTLEKLTAQYGKKDFQK